MANRKLGDATLERIWATIEDIPPGRVANYGQVAELAGLPRGARLVCYALRVVPEERRIPWFRVINAQGRIAIAKDSPGYKEQAERLRAEGVVVNGGRVDMRKFRWQPDLDELLWKPSVSWDQS